jgi:hypothetical protein
LIGICFFIGEKGECQKESPNKRELEPALAEPVGLNLVVP